VSKLINNGTGSALGLQVQPGNAPMTVDSDTQVANLNADKLDGKQANQLARVASFTGPSPLAPNTNGTVATTTITAPASGFLVIDGGSTVHFSSAPHNLSCSIRLDSLLLSDSTRYRNLGAAPASGVARDSCSTNTVVPVAAGTHTIELDGFVEDTPNTTWGNTGLSAMYIPFDGSGASP
jgi:hypothetical protein